ncbi:putative glucan endo-1,3-beta-D-glucosidase [Helianthus debilis subsp. tardiflorus]
MSYPDVEFCYISVGNEVKPSDGTLAPLVYSVLTNIHEVVVFYGLGKPIKVSTSIDTTLIEANFPTSQHAFRDDVRVFTLTRSLHS